MLTTDQKGAIAETAIVHAAIKLGVGVYKPVMDGGRYDLILEVRSQLLRTSASGRRSPKAPLSFAAIRRVAALIV